ncbi:hypothetical protein CC2G_009846 [Coprinopsis cinerea AmutBmut pab1-1]|nr:hypothetical protein CC2G_009846 [Coprinopsis cinerea AmutBmut pab1-1]
MWASTLISQPSRRDSVASSSNKTRRLSCLLHSTSIPSPTMSLKLHTAVALALSLVAGKAAAAPSLQELRGCSNQLFTQGNLYTLSSARTNEGLVQCDYLYRNPEDQTTAEAHCWYDKTGNLVRLPDTPVPGIDSDERCATILVPAGFYRLRTSEDGKCVTAMGEGSGAVELQECATDIWSNAKQIWHPQGSTLQVAGTAFDCLEVPESTSANGMNLRIAACNAASANQQFEHLPEKWFVAIPNEKITWLGDSSQCLDIPNGQAADGTPVSGLGVW